MPDLQVNNESRCQTRQLDVLDHHRNPSCCIRQGTLVIVQGISGLNSPPGRRGQGMLKSMGPIALGSDREQFLSLRGKHLQGIQRLGESVLPSYNYMIEVIFFIPQHTLSQQTIREFQPTEN